MVGCKGSATMCTSMFSALCLQPQSLEDSLRNQANQEHYGTPERGRVDQVFAFEDRLDDPGGNGFRSGDQEHTRPPESHRRVHKAGLDGDDPNAGTKEPVPKSLEKDGQSRLGGSVDVVALPAPIAGD